MKIFSAFILSLLICPHLSAQNSSEEIKSNRADIVISTHTGISNIKNEKIYSTLIKINKKQVLTILFSNGKITSFLFYQEVQNQVTVNLPTKNFPKWHILMFEKSAHPLKRKMLDGIILEHNGRFRYLTPEEWEIITNSFEYGVETIKDLNKNLNSN